MVTRTGNKRAIQLLAAGMLMIVAAAAIAGDLVNAVTIADHMDKSKYSSAEIKTYLKGLKGGSVTADGKIQDIMIGKTANRVVLSVNAGRSHDFVVDVFVNDSSALHKGEHVSCKGDYVKYNPWTVNGITLKDGTCTKK